MSNEKENLVVYTIREYTQNRQKKSVWTKIGIAFPHKNGPGFTLHLDALPVDGKLTLYPFAEKKDGDTEGPQDQPETTEAIDY